MSRPIRVAVWHFFPFLFLLCSAQNPIEKCPQLPPHTPKDVNDVAPNNIRVVMALGDSITAGFGIMGKEGGLDEYRGLSGPIGGDPHAITVANFFAHYTQQGKLVGPSMGSHLVELPGEGYYANDNLNAAQSAAARSDLNHQIDYLIQTVTSNPDVNMTADWKFVNFLLGANDACPLCWEFSNRPQPDAAADDFMAKTDAAIERVYQNFPRTIFNILLMFNVSGVYDLSLQSDYCWEFHDVAPWECPCAFDSTDANREYLDTVLHLYGQRMIKLANKWKAKNLPEFTVIYQPFTYNLKIQDLGLEYISTLDCFHPSLLAHQKIGIASWNSLIVPMSQKATTFDPSAPLKCADANSRIFTN